MFLSWLSDVGADSFNPEMVVTISLYYLTFAGRSWQVKGWYLSLYFEIPHEQSKRKFWNSQITKEMLPWLQTVWRIYILKSETYKALYAGLFLYFIQIVPLIILCRILGIVVLLLFVVKDLLFVDVYLHLFATNKGYGEKNLNKLHKRIKLSVKAKSIAQPRATRNT